MAREKTRQAFVLSVNQAVKFKVLAAKKRTPMSTIIENLIDLFIESQEYGVFPPNVRIESMLKTKAPTRAYTRRHTDHNAGSPTP